MNKEQIFKVLTCPVNWEACLELDCTTEASLAEACMEHVQLLTYLNYLWVLKVRKYEVDRESSLFEGSDYFFVPSDWEVNELTDDERSRFKHNQEIWREPSVSEYNHEYGLFEKINCCGPDVYPKHYSPVNCTNEEVCKLSKNKGISVLSPYFNINKQKQVMWMALSEILRIEVIWSYDVDEWKAVEARFGQLFNLGHLRLFVMNCESYKYGAVNGLLTQCCCVDFDLNTPQFHIFPVDETEFERGAFSVVLDTGPIG